MKASKSSDPQIAFILKQTEAGTAVEKICRNAEISGVTFPTWQVKHTELMYPEMMRLRHLARENARLKRLAADLSLDTAMLRDALSKVYDPPCSGKEQDCSGQSID